MTEREKIVVWLKRLSAAQYRQRYSLRERLFFAWTAIVWPENLFAGCWKGTATAIEEGQHLIRPEPTIPASEWKNSPSVGH